MATLREVYQQIMQAQADQDEAIEYLRVVSQASDDAKRDFELAAAEAYLKADGTVDERKAHVVIETNQLSYTYDISKSLVAAAKRNMDRLDKRISSLMTVMSTVRAQLQLERVLGGDHPGDPGI